MLNVPVEIAMLTIQERQNLLLCFNVPVPITFHAVLYAAICYATFKIGYRQAHFLVILY